MTLYIMWDKKQRFLFTFTINFYVQDEPLHESVKDCLVIVEMFFKTVSTAFPSLYKTEETNKLHHKLLTNDTKPPSPQ